MDRQKTFMIFGAALVCASLLTWFLYAKTVAPKMEKMAVIQAAARNMPIGTRLTKADLRSVRVPERSLPAGAIEDPKMASGRVLLYPMNTNEPILSTKLTSVSGVEGLPSTIQPGMRAISVQFTDATGVSGLIQPRSRVDVIFTRTGSLTEALTTTLLQDVQVLSIGRSTEVQTTVDPKAPRSHNQTATLMVTPEQARKLEFAKNLGKISLALRNPLDRSVAEDSSPATAADLDPLLFGGKRRRIPTPDVSDKKVWDRLTSGDEEEKPKEKEPPPKPKLVVDVYRGDKHVQEIFQ